MAEWKIRRIAEPSKEPKESFEQRVKSWALSSIGVDGVAQDTYNYLNNVDMATAEDLSNFTRAPIEEVYDVLDLLYTTGLVEKMGKAFYVRDKLSTSIVKKLIPRITESLREIAKAESSTRSEAEYYHKMRGRAYSDVREAISAYREILRTGASVSARAVGSHGYTGESVEVEGLIIEHSYHPPNLVILTESGEKMIVGGKHDRGVDIRAQTVVVRGEKNE
jgi:hypothetical protein